MVVMKKIFIYAMLLLAGVSCQKMEISEGESSEVKLDQDRVRLKALLADRDTRWTVDELEIPAEVSGVFQITNDTQFNIDLINYCKELVKQEIIVLQLAEQLDVVVQRVLSRQESLSEQSGRFAAEAVGHQPHKGDQPSYSAHLTNGFSYAILKNKQKLK